MTSIFYYGTVILSDNPRATEINVSVDSEDTRHNLTGEAENISNLSSLLK